ncbi:MAG: glycoside hydrolase family 3 C-terminal domain-containing protein, partial [Candidatus Omnitrophica bacterium]|nr:glycoside hydrolase family 3 C-terminal domain-containing protein [Candidatus Omnitrophota bacterium]
MNRLKRCGVVVGLFTVFCIVFTAFVSAEKADSSPYKNPELPIEERIEDLLGRMTIEEKIAQVSGKDRMDTRENKRLGIPALKMTDGPHGVGWGESTCFPTGVTMGASWNPSLIEVVGRVLGREARAKGRNVLLGPCINIHRTPLGGRNFESFGEDPYLIGRLAAAYVKGVQSQKIGTSTKHLACNNQERDRFTISVEIDERALREIYLPGFKAAVCEAGGLTVMGAYNLVNGSYCCANRHLLLDILKKEWGFQGLVVSDWGAVHSTNKSAKGGLDLEMPGPGEYFGDELLKAVKNGKVSEEILDDKVRRTLRVMFLLDLFDGVDPKYRGACDTREHRILARRLAEEGTVLLRNEGGVLPLNKQSIKSIAVIGSNAAEAQMGGGGSSTVRSRHSVSPLKGLERMCEGKVAIKYAKGCMMPGEMTILPSTFLIPPDGSKQTKGLKGEYFNNLTLSGEPVLTRIDEKVDFDWGDGSPAPAVNNDNFSVRWTGKIIPDVSGKYELAMLTDDGCRLYLNDKLLIDSWWDHALETHRGTVFLEAGRPYNARIEYYEKGGGATAKLGFVAPGDDMLREAVEIAAKSDAAVIFAGLSWKVEGEGVDKANIALPAGQNELIKAV